MPWTFFDSSGRKLNTASTLIDNLDIDGATDIGADIVDADLFIIDDGAGGANRKTAASRIKTYAGVTQAVKSDIEDETNQDTYIPPDLLKHHPGISKAWVKFTPPDTTIDQDYGVSSVTDNDVGRFAINFSVAFADTHYAAVMGFKSDGDAGNQHLAEQADSPTVRTTVKNDLRYLGADSSDDPAIVSVAYFGAQ
jgi:hypothetical protein